MFKKSFILLAALMLFISTGCAATPVETTTVPTQQTTVPSTEAPTTVPETTVPETTEPAFTEITLVDNDTCTMIIKGIDEENLFGYTLNVFLENKTDKELMFSMDGVSVNGFMCDPFWASTVSAGKKSNAQITFLDSDFEANGIEDVTEISFTLKVYDNNDWLAGNLVEESFTVNP